MRVAAETRIQAFENELKTVHGELSKSEAGLKGARARIHNTVVDFKNSPVFESYFESRRQQ